MTMIIRYQTKDEPLTQVEQISDVPNNATIVWLDFEDATSKENDFLIENYNFNYLELEDAIKGVPRVKYKSYDDYQYMVFHSMHKDNFTPIALNVFLDGKTLITYHQHHFESLMEVVKMNARKHDPDLDCADIVIHILDMMVDKYFDFVYTIEDEVIVDYKHSMYIQHIDDHIIKQNNIIRTSQEMTNEIRENFESYSSFRMNSIMQVLTLVSVIFSPLTFIVGVYGMNFEYMPELKWHYGYFICLTIMLLISIALILFFKKKKWF